MKNMILHLFLTLVVSTSRGEPATRFFSDGRPTQTFSNDESFISSLPRRKPASGTFFLSEPVTPTSAINPFSDSRKLLFGSRAPATRTVSQLKPGALTVTPTRAPFTRSFSQGEPGTLNFPRYESANPIRPLGESGFRAPVTRTFSHRGSSISPRRESETRNFIYGEPLVEVLTDYSYNDGLGNYKFGFSQSDNTYRWEKGELKYFKGKQYVYKTGGYAFMTEDKKLRVTNYVANENGYQPTETEGPGGVPARLLCSACG